MANNALSAFLASEAGGNDPDAPQMVPQDGALRAFLGAEIMGSPYDAANKGAPANMPEDLVEVDPDAYAGDLNKQHSRLVRWFEEAERVSQKARELAERDRDYCDNFNDNQWSDAEKAALADRGQPITTTNYVRRKVELLSGLERKSRTDPKAYPRTPSEEDRADTATQVLRYIGDACNTPVIRSSVYKNLLVEGFGGAEIGLEDDGQGGADITITHIEWDRLWFDPHSRAGDFSDARYLGVVLWMDADQLEDLYPDAADVLGDTFASDHGTYRDKPGAVAWHDNQRRRARVIQVYWHERGIWWAATLTRAGFLAAPQKSPFKDAKGRSACPLILQSAYVDRDNNRFGMVRDLISQQDGINKQDSKSLHLLAVTQIVMEKGAVEDVDKARREAARPDGVIERVPGLEFEIVRGGDLAMAHFQLLQHRIAEMQASGPNASMSGTDPRQQSGRAILASQAGGAAANEPLADALRQWTRRLYETCWMAAREFWNGQRWIRVTDDLGKAKFIGLNRPVTLAEDLAAMEPDERAAKMQELGVGPGDPRYMQVVRIENDISDLGVDITIEEGEDVPALAAEQFQMLTQLAGSQPGLIPPDVLIAASQLKNKGELLERMKAAQEAQGQTQAQQAQMQAASAEADVRGKNAKAAADEALAAERTHGAVATIARVHKEAAESPAIPVDGPGLMPQNELAPGQ
jgi:hypothetical protein